MILEKCESAASAAGFTSFELGSTLTGVPFYAARGYVETGRIEIPLIGEEVFTVVQMGKNVTL